MTTSRGASQPVPWLAMVLATALLVAAGSLAACRVGPARTTSFPEPASRSITPDGPAIRVRILRETTAALVGSTSALAFYDAEEPDARWTGEGPVRVTHSPSGFVLSAPSGAGAVIRSERLRITSARGGFTVGEGADQWVLDGSLELGPRSDVSGEAFDLVESIAMERYLPGVLAKELYRDFHPTAYEAQAIAARTYALHERERRLRIGSTFDVEASTMDQAYAGASSHPRAAEAVARTSGLVLTWDGQLLRTYYSSTCGDRPASARDTWPTTTGFEFNLAEPIQARPRACACGVSPRHRWSLTRSTAEVSARLRAWGGQAGHAVKQGREIRSIDVAERNAAGRPMRYRLTDESDTRYVLSAEELRVGLNTPAAGFPEITGATRVSSGDLVATRRGALFEIEGRGFGHGVGMCQFGANGLGKQGLSASMILAKYYPGARLERAYE